MNKKSLLLLILIGLFIPAFAFASAPSDQVVQQIQSHIQALKDNPESEVHREAFFTEFDSVYREHGVTGVSWIGYQEPVLMEALISPKFLGLENVVLSLLPLASDREELFDMMTVVVRSQVVTNLDPTAESHLSFLKEGALDSPVSLTGEELEQLISEAVTAGIEKGETVQTAFSNNDRFLRRLIALRDWLVSIGRLRFVPKLNHIISDLR